MFSFLRKSKKAVPEPKATPFESLLEAIELSNPETSVTSYVSGEKLSILSSQSKNVTLSYEDKINNTKIRIGYCDHDRWEIDFHITENGVLRKYYPTSDEKSKILKMVWRIINKKEQQENSNIAVSFEKISNGIINAREQTLLAELASLRKARTNNQEMAHVQVHQQETQQLEGTLYG